MLNYPLHKDIKLQDQFKLGEF